MKKLFTITVDNTIDLITNSSSELFVLQGNTKEHVTEMIRAAYPNYLNEYREVQSIDELSNDEIDHYLDYHLCTWNEKHRKLLPGFTYDEIYAPMKEFSDMVWLKPVTDETRERYLNAISPKRDMYFLWSLDENPDWDYQERLSNIARRYHLG